MNLFEGLRIGLLEIRSHKLRGFLTMLGIAIGITSVVAMTGILSGFQNDIRRDINNMGAGRLFIFAKETNDNTNRSSGLLYEDAQAIRGRFPDAPTVSPSASTEIPLFYRDFNAKVEVRGVSPDWAKLDWNYKIHGRFFNAADIRDDAQVCVLIKKTHKMNDGTEFAQEDPLSPLFKRYDPLKNEIRLGGASFRVVGILQELPKDNDNDDGDHNETVLLPITSFQKRLSFEHKQIDRIDLDSGDQASSYLLAKRVFALLKRRHHDVEDFQVMNIVDMMGPVMQWFDLATFIMAAVAGIALFAGGVGIMNISLASVNARIKEIGIRKSLGARDKDIRLQFLLEAVALSLMGGVLGVFLGTGVCLLVKTFTRMKVSISPASIFISLIVSVIVGIAFSWYPARRASQLDPIEALRYE